MSKVKASLLVFSIVLFATDRDSLAQSAACIVSARVDVAIVMSSISTLEFSQVARGVRKSVLLGDPNAAQILVQGPPEKELIMKFILPYELRNGTSTMPISFSTLDAGHGEESLNPIHAEKFNPHEETIAALPELEENGTLYIWLGGTVTPGDAQQNGQYRGQILLVTSSASN